MSTAAPLRRGGDADCAPSYPDPDDAVVAQQLIQQRGDVLAALAAAALVRRARALLLPHTPSREHLRSRAQVLIAHSRLEVVRPEPRPAGPPQAEPAVRACGCQPWLDGRT